VRIEPNIAPVAALFGEPSRAALLTVLLDGRALPASELARIAGLSATAASGHLRVRLEISVAERQLVIAVRSNVYERLMIHLFLDGP
jgi:hypothetical protein